MLIIFEKNNTENNKKISAGAKDIPNKSIELIRCKEYINTKVDNIKYGESLKSKIIKPFLKFSTEIIP
jgi:hypothetical protein